MTVFLRRYWFWIVVTGLISLRFVGLLYIPQQPFIDEVASIAQAHSIEESQRDIHGTSWPVASVAFMGGYMTGPYYYPLAAWFSVFGDSVLSARAFSQTVTILAIGLLSYGLLLWGSRRLTCIAIVVGLTLPWSWVGGNLAWDSMLPPLYVAAAFVCFSVLARKQLSTTQQLLLSTGMSLALIIAAWVYPPCRVVGPLLLGGAFVWLWKNHRMALSQLATAVVIAGLASLPLLNFILQPSALERSSALNVFAQQPLPEALITIIQSFLLLINPITLFVTGDSNLRHSTHLFGMLGTWSLLPLVILAYVAAKRLLSKTQRSLAIIACFGVIAGLLGSALANDGSSPHYLRAVAAWPFFVILISLGWEMVLQQPARIRALTLGIACFGVIWFVVDLYTAYPVRADPSFSYGSSEPYGTRIIEYYEHRRAHPWP